MIDSKIDSYSYLWDGSAPHWHLRPLPQLFEAAIMFENGFTAKDVLKLKNISPQYAQEPTSELLSRLRGTKHISLGTVTRDAAASLQKKCEEANVDLRLEEQDLRYVIVNDLENSILAIEDNNIYGEVKKRMLAASVRVLKAE